MDRSKINQELGEIEQAAQDIGRMAHQLAAMNASSKTLVDELETLHRRNVNQLKAMIANLGYAIGRNSEVK